MRSAPITKQDVVDAVAELEASGVKPSTPRLIVKLGRGSATTISRYLKEIREERAAEDDKGDLTLPAPGELVAKLTQLFTGHAEDAYKLIRAPVEALLEERTRALESERADMQEELSQALAELVQAKERIGSLEEAQSADARRIGQLQNQVAELEIDRNTARDRHAEELVAAERRQDDAVRRTQEQANATLAVSRDEVINLRAQAESQARAVEQLQQRLDQAQGDMAEVRAQLAGQKQAVGVAESAYRDEITAHGRTRDDLAKLQGSAQAERTDLLDRLQRQEATYRTADSELRGRLEASLAEQGELRGRLKALEAAQAALDEAPSPETPVRSTSKRRTGNKP